MAAAAGVTVISADIRFSVLLIRSLWGQYRAWIDLRNGKEREMPGESHQLKI